MRKIFEIEDCMILDMFSTQSREDTIKRLAYAAAYFTKPQYKCRACRIREKVCAMTDGEWEGFFHRTRGDVGNLIRSIKTCMWSAALGRCANADFVLTNNK